jgi:hypothetical protein
MIIEKEMSRNNEAKGNLYYCKSKWVVKIAGNEVWRILGSKYV